MARDSLSRSARERSDFRSAPIVAGVVAACSRAVLWLAVLLYAAHAGASLFGMLVVTPESVEDSQQLPRHWTLVARGAIRPIDYEEPAVLALGVVSLVMLWLSLWRTAGRAWMALSGVFGITLVAITVVFVMPILERAVSNATTSLADQRIVMDAHAWQLWCKVRLVLLVVAWAASLMALQRSSSRQPRHWAPSRARL